jgi:nitroreductase
LALSARRSSQLNHTETVRGGTVNPNDLRTIVEAAVHAPSVHDTQPWRFAAHCDDLSRDLP